MNFDGLTKILLTEERILVKESILNIFQNPKAVIATSILLGIAHANYTYPKLKELVVNRINHSKTETLNKLLTVLPDKMHTTEVDFLYNRIAKNTNDSTNGMEHLGPKQEVNKTNSSYSDFLKKAYAKITEHEGIRNKLYRDIYGNWTIGIGHLVTEEELPKFKNRVLSKNEIQEIFKNDVNKKMASIKREFGSTWNKFSEDLKITILDGYFRGDLSGSPRAKYLLKKGRYKEAAEEYLNNREYRLAVKAKSGVASRMMKNAQVIANG